MILQNPGYDAGEALIQIREFKVCPKYWSRDRSPMNEFHPLL
jgi:hypothetical protein